MRLPGTDTEEVTASNPAGPPRPNPRSVLMRPLHDSRRHDACPLFAWPQRTSKADTVAVACRARRVPIEMVHSSPLTSRDAQVYGPVTSAAA